MIHPHIFSVVYIIVSYKVSTFFSALSCHSSMMIVKIDRIYFIFGSKAKLSLTHTHIYNINLALEK